jgi:FkbM family methyltransferase
MINFSSISNRSFLGKLLRFPLRFIPSKMITPILQGGLKGKKWIVESSNHGCWLGSYEYEKQKLFANTVKEGAVVYDIGAHVGFYTLLASELVGPKGKVIAFEPLHRNIYYLKEHLRLNQCENVKVIEAAVAEQNGGIFFEESLNSHTSHISSKGCIKVRTVNLDDLVLNDEIPLPDYIKIDVEGAEFLVISGAKSMLAKHQPTIFLAAHGIEVHQQCITFLHSIGYKLLSINSKNIDETSEILAMKKG